MSPAMTPSLPATNTVEQEPLNPASTCFTRGSLRRAWASTRFNSSILSWAVAVSRGFRAG